MSLPPWEEIDHTADWALRVRGKDRRELFEHAARGMMSLLGDVAPSDVTRRHQIALQAIDKEALLVKWLTELLYLIENEGTVFSEIRVQRADETSLDAEVEGGPPREELRKHIKAVTYHLLDIRTTDEGLETTIVFDV
jgi:SHS2 domain-containing protein